MQISYYWNDAHHTAQVEVWEQPSAGQAGMAMGLIALTSPTLDAGALPQDLPVDVEQYAFTHGGEQYRAACRAAWGAIMARKSGATVVGLP